MAHIAVKADQAHEPSAAVGAKLPGWRFLSSRAALYLIVAVVVLIQFFPIIWSLLTSLMSPAETTSIPATLFPTHPSLSNYQQALTSDIGGFKIGQFYLNSVIVSTVSTIATMFLAMLAAYAFARLNFRFKSQILLIVLALSLFPPLAQLIPILRILLLSKTILGIQLFGTIGALIVPYSVLGLPLAILILIAFFQEIPKDLEEAAMIDGMSRFQAFLRVILPLTIPGFFTTAIIVFVGNWNEYLFALNYTTTSSYTLPVGIVTISQSEYVTNFGILTAATVMAVVPLVILILLLERRIVSGLTAGAVKG